jgi:hypothetical protein
VTFQKRKSNMSLPKWIKLNEYVVDKALMPHEIIAKIKGDYPEYRIIGSLDIKYAKGPFKFIYCTLKYSEVDNFASRYGI